MRVALLAPLFESVPPKLYGGTERVIHNLCRGLIDADTEVTLFASGDSCVEAKVVPVVDKAFRLREDQLSDPNIYHIRMLSMIAERADQFDIIHNHHDYWMLPLSVITRTPLLTTMHGRLDLPEIPRLLSNFSNNYFVSISDAQRTPVKHLKWMKTIYHGIDVESFRFFPKPGNYLAFLGRMSPEKRPEWAIEIAKSAGVPLKMAAKVEKGESEQYFETVIRPKIDGKFIEYVGEISEAEKAEFLGKALALIFPIDWPEPFGLVSIESLAVGTPVLARPCGAIPEILKDGVTGYCDPDINRLAKFVSMIGSLDRRKCRDWVKKKFSFSRMAEEYLDVYRKLVGKA